MRNLGELTGLNLASISHLSLRPYWVGEKGSANKLIALIVIDWRLVVCSVHALSLRSVKFLSGVRGRYTHHIRDRIK